MAESYMFDNGWLWMCMNNSWLCCLIVVDSGGLAEFDNGSWMFMGSSPEAD